MTINLEQLKTDLITQLSTVDTESADELMLLVASVNNLTEDRVISVPTIDDLPELQSLSPDKYDELPSGNIFYVDSIGVLVISCKEKWIGLDGRVLRDDTIVTTAYGWGSNSIGRIGDGTTVNKSSPVTITGGINNWIQIEAADLHVLGLSLDKVIYSWGRNTHGRIGDGTTVDKSSPVTVIGDITNWKQISAAYTHSLGITETGIAYSWGRNDLGQLGDGTIDNKSSPITVIGGITNWKQVSAGRRFSLGVTENGIAYGWGANNNANIISYGTLGDGTTINRSSPVTVIGNITDWKQLSAGETSSAGVTNSGLLYTWGDSFNGKLGDNTFISRSSPVTVVGGITDWKQVSVGGGHVLAVTNSGIAYAWGSNSNGRLGDNTTVNKSSPVTVVGGITNWKQVSAGISHSLGITEDGIAYAWGRNFNGELGINNTTSRSSPTLISGGINTWVIISGGDSFSVGITT